VTVFRVWAPDAARVEVALGADSGDHWAMESDGGDWWTHRARDAGPGTDYAFVVDGEGPFPDPRSGFQPAGVHGPSRVVDHAVFEWTDDAWNAPELAAAIFYELHVGTFSEAGTFDGAIEHLDHLVELGITHVELMPVAEFPGTRGWGYDGVGLYAPHHGYGGPDGLKRLLNACHDRGLAVVLDVVYNHLGPDGNHLSRFGPYFSHRYTTPWGDAVNFDGPGSDEVRRFVIDNARMWLRDYHIDGLRLDAVHEIFDQSAVHILEELAAELHRAAADLGRRFVVIAESDLNNPRLVEPGERGGYGLDAQWNDDFRHALHVTLTGEQDRFHASYHGIHDVATALRRIYVYEGRYSEFRRRRHGRPAGDLPATRFVGFLQNHDQVGNRALGERSSQLLPPDALLLAAAAVVLSPFIPLVFAGEEWAASTPFMYFTDHEDAELAEAVRAGRQREFEALIPDGANVPDPQSRHTFDRSRLRWDELGDEQHKRLLDWHRRLIAYRHDHPALRDGSRPAVRFDDVRCWLTAERAGITLALNASVETCSVPLDRLDGWQIALASSDAVRLDGPSVQLPPWGAAVLERS
jgi:maltooligosyltrehalose trehalohydrolase